jgi:hypothetical protein
MAQFYHPQGTGRRIPPRGTTPRGHPARCHRLQVWARAETSMLVHVAVTFDKMSDLPKLSAQLTRLGATEVSPEPSEHKVYGRVPITQLHRLSLLRFAERSFLVLHRRFLNVDGNDPVFSGDISSLEDALRTSDWARAISCWSTLHGRAPNSWVADSKRSNATHKMFAAHGIDRLVLQHTTRTALGEVRACCPYLCVVYASCCTSYATASVLLLLAPLCRGGRRPERRAPRDAAHRHDPSPAAHPALPEGHAAKPQGAPPFVVLGSWAHRAARAVRWGARSRPVLRNWYVRGPDG